MGSPRIGYVVLWLLLALSWAAAATLSSGIPPAETLQYGFTAMAAAASMGLLIWRWTASVPLNWGVARFYRVHIPGLAVFATVYALSWVPLRMLHEGFRAGLDFSSPALPWNALMGSWLYLTIAGAAYALRGQEALRLQRAQVAEAALLAQQAQLAALRSQVNPHFLFNALHSVGALIGLDPPKAEVAVERLGDLLRYALNDADTVPLRHEWRFIEDYLAFERLRLGERLRVVDHVAEEALAVVVPPLFLQPVVENAVRHGIADRPEGGRLELSAGLEGDRLVVRVHDDGGRVPGDGGLGIGLSSLRRRLAVQYGEAAVVQVHDSAPGFGVTITLPTDGRHREDT
ncbi:MAG: sensor histidine kinase [Vicinamibacterales bacterium]